MNEQDAFELAYKNGYEKGKADATAEIFSEIEDVMNNIGYFDEIDFEALKKKFIENRKD